MSNALLTVVSHDVLTIHDSSAQRLDRNRAKSIVADACLIRYLEPLEPTHEWSNPLARELDIIAQSHDEVLLIIMRTYDAESDADAALACARHDPALDGELVARLKQIVDAYVADKRLSLNINDTESIEGVVVDVISTPTRTHIVEHHNLAYVDYDGLCDEDGDWSRL